MKPDIDINWHQFRLQQLYVHTYQKYTNSKAHLIEVLNNTYLLLFRTVFISAKIIVKLSLNRTKDS